MNPLNMDNLFGNIETFNVHSNNVGIRWQKWIKRFDNFLIASGITDNERKQAMLLHCVGDEVFDIFNSLPDPTNSAVNMTCYEKAKLKLNNYFTPKINTEFEIYNFRQAKQIEGECIDEYYARLLKLSTDCGFTDRDREIKSQIIQGTVSTKLRRYAMTENPTLPNLLAQAKVYEITEAQVNQMEGNRETVNKMTKKYTSKLPSSNQTRNNNKKCNNCGNNWHQSGRNSCPAFNIICHFCSKKGHFAKVCIQKQENAELFTFSRTIKQGEATEKCQSSSIKLIQTEK